MFYIGKRAHWILKWDLFWFHCNFLSYQRFNFSLNGKELQYSFRSTPEQSHKSQILLYFSFVYSGSILLSRLHKTSSGFCSPRGFLNMGTHALVVLKVWFLRLVASASPGNMLGMQVPRPPLDLLNQKLWRWCLGSPPVDSDAHFEHHGLVNVKGSR